MGCSCSDIIGTNSKGSTLGKAQGPTETLKQPGKQQYQPSQSQVPKNHLDKLPTFTTPMPPSASNQTNTGSDKGGKPAEEQQPNKPTQQGLKLGQRKLEMKDFEVIRVL